MLDFKTFIQILAKDLETSPEDQEPYLWKRSYANFIAKQLEEREASELTFRELEVIQTLIARDEQKYLKKGVYEMTVKKSLDRVIYKDYEQDE